MKILKFGGTSVANSENILKVLEIIKKKSDTERLIVVVSAFSGVTDKLFQAARTAADKDPGYQHQFAVLSELHTRTLKELVPRPTHLKALSDIKEMLSHLGTLLDGCFLLGELSDRSADTILGFGELLSSQIIAAALNQNVSTKWKDSRELLITNARFGCANVDFFTTNLNLTNYFKLSEDIITLMPGFIAATPSGDNTTLGRGGSDFTAAIIAAALGAAELEIWTDVNGMYTANPKIVKQARPIERITYHEAMELSHFGAKVLYPPTIQPALINNIPIRILNTFDPEAVGTYISNEQQEDRGTVKGISHIDRIALITVEGSGIVGVPGFSKRLFEALSNEKINVIFITQASSEHSICIGISETDVSIAQRSIDDMFEFEITQKRIDACTAETGLCIVALVGENMKNHQGLSGRMFSTLGKNNVNIRAIAQGASERNISVVINESDVRKALNSLHERFFEDNIRQLNLFVMGLGNVGQKFIEQISQQRKYLKENLKINVRVIGLANSRKMYFNPEGIPLKDWQKLLDEGQVADKKEFSDMVRKLNLRNSIFVDITASDEVASIYPEYLRQNVAVVTCNKIACASDYDNYRNLKSMSRQYNAPFLFETNVGAGLPIIDTLKHLIASGDKIHTIHAVLSGSLNFIFNNFKDGVSFAEIVREAGVQGFTEPDPRIDLSGVDVARKILILVRESGNHKEIEDIINRPFLPGSSMNTRNVEEFFESLEHNAAHFNNLYRDASDQGCRLKYVAKFENGEASVGLECIPADHPFYNLEGKDNIVLFYTDRYVDQPLIIKGAGAGAAVTASGIFADIIRIGNIA